MLTAIENDPSKRMILVKEWLTKNRCPQQHRPANVGRHRMPFLAIPMNCPLPACKEDWQSFRRKKQERRLLQETGRSTKSNRITRRARNPSPEPPHG